MWKLQPEAEYEKRVRKWPNKYRRELKAMHDNLDTVFGALNQGAKLEHVNFGFIHREPRGVLGIDQKGGGAGLKQTRLYVYADTATEIVHLVTIGDKNTQQADIKHATEFVDALTKNERSDNG
jgi:putative component of toxin-antitoxin plasmid stabilization module